MFHDVRWGGRHDGRFLWVLLNSGSCGAFAFNHDVKSLTGVHSYRQPAGYFPISSGTLAGVSLPGPVDIEAGTVGVKDLATGAQVDVPADSVVAEVITRLA